MDGGRQKREQITEMNGSQDADKVIDGSVSDASAPMLMDAY